jgi:Na+-translocating ferredoxin:NAD+ oxidoreductase RnfD subunit
MSLMSSSLWPYVVLVLVGFLPNEIWRAMGFVLARGVDESSEILVWVRAVATAVLAAVIAKLIFFAPGTLATVPLAVRVTALLAGFVGFLVLKRSVFAGVAVGEAVLIAGAILLRY